MLKNRILSVTLTLASAATLPAYAQSSSGQAPAIADWPSNGKSNPCTTPLPGQKTICPPAQQVASGSSSSQAQAPQQPVTSTVEVTVPPSGVATLSVKPSKSEFVMTSRVRPFRQWAAGVKFSPLGVGVETATPLAQHFNLRMGANFLTYNGTFDDSGWTYGANLDFRSGQVQLDYFPFQHFGGFHISPGLLIHKNHGGADISVKGGNKFEMGDGTYTSSVSDPVKGNATFTYDRSAAALLSIGFGNLLPRNGRHWSIPFEIGGAFTSAPKFGLNLDGTVCDNQGCGKISSDAGAMADLQKQRVKIQNNLNDYASVYPIISIGFAWNFGPRN